MGFCKRRRIRAFYHRNLGIRAHEASSTTLVPLIVFSRFLKIQELRKYLIHAMKITEPPIGFWINPDRFIDDFIFLCFFLGNDFLPPLLSLETHELHEKHAACINSKGVQRLMGDVSSFGGKELKGQEFEKYVEGLYWVLCYYFGGVWSWSWYYGKHDDATCPSESADALPEADKAPMICSESNVHPPGSNVDKDEKQNMPQDEEVRRKAVAHEMIFVQASHDLGPQVASLYHGFVHASGNEQIINKITIDSEKSDGLNGFLMRCNKQVCIDDDSSSLLKGMEKNDVVCAIFENPLFDHHNPEPPKHVTMPEKIQFSESRSTRKGLEGLQE
ncbi:5'-3' exoribonuclease 3-like isoform X2 [Magnolia sinica]|uniref:5'-3' exoribonuclease 3-like isoform X2 n=1 Tax=Magnolia sinica TaxID=86752 RepID=UPI002658A3D8|nr:5'-3' exoribonuclease 3-like isoform X2 [Magnolia sinica]